MRLLVCIPVLALALVGCDGIDASVQPRQSVDTPPANGPAAELATHVSEGGLRTLTQYEYARTIRDLFGDEVVVPKLSHDTSVSGWTTVGASVSAIAPNASDDLETAALEIAKQVFAETRRAKVVSCVPSGTADDPCLRSFVETWGRRVFRRPLSNEERDQYVALATVTGADLGNAWGGLEMALAGMLESPNFVYRLDAIEDDPTTPGESRFTPYSMASRLSYFLWSSAPDDELLDAASRGELGTSDGIARSMERMLATEKAKSGVLHFFDEWLHISRIETVDKDPKLFPELTPALRVEMREQIARTVEDLVWTRDASYLDLLDTRDIFMSPGLAPFYGVQPPSASGFTKITLDASQPRAGLLGWAGILTLESRAYASSPTLRGLFVRERLLCQTVPPPPQDATQQQPQEMNGKPLTTRQRAEARLANPNCSSCHARMDGIGLGLENFDAIGRYRTTEDSVDIDASGQVDNLPFNGAVELAKRVHDHPNVTACGARNLFRYATGRIENRDDESHVQDLAIKFKSIDHRMKRMFAEIVVSSAFRRPKTTTQGGQ